MGRDFRCSVNLNRMQKWWNGVLRRENTGFVCKVLWIMSVRDGLHLQGEWRELLRQHPASHHVQKPRRHVGAFSLLSWLTGPFGPIEPESITEARKPSASQRPLSEGMLHQGQLTLGLWVGAN